MLQAFENVETLLKELAPLLIESGVPTHQVKMPAGRLPEFIPVEKFAEAFDWLHLLSQSEAYAAVIKVKKLRTQEIWDRYKAYGIRGLQEQILLEAAQLRLRKAWKTNRPSFFGRVYNDAEREAAEAAEQDDNQQDSGSEQLRSEEARPDEGDRGRRRGRPRKQRVLPPQSNRGNSGRTIADGS